MDLIEIEKMIAEVTVKLEAENARLREELAAAQLDAARYRWLTDQDADREIDIATWDGEHWCCCYAIKEHTDAAIDAAMKEQCQELAAAQRIEQGEA